MIAAQERPVGHAPVGACIVPGGVEYRVWAPDVPSVHCLTEQGGRLALIREEEGYFSGIDERGRAGDRYRFELPNGVVPDPASRYQPCGVEGPSQVIDPNAFC